MKKIFSVKGLISIAIFVLSLLALYLILLILPLFKPLWNVLYSVAIPFIISMIIAYLLHPLVDTLMKFKLNRLLSIFVIYILFFGGFGLLIWFGTPFIINQVKEIALQLPEIQSNMENGFTALDNHIERLPKGIHQGIDDAIRNLEESIRKLMAGILQAIGGIVGNIMFLLVIPFLVFYLLHDVEAIQKLIIFMVPRSKRKLVVKLWKDIDHSLAEYIRGQIIVSLIVWSGCLIGYSIIGLPYALFLSLFVAIANIIPYFGPYLGAAPAVIVAFMTNPSIILWVILINTVMQVIEGNVLSPWIVGKRLHIHPLFIIFALLVGAQLGGVIGLILAVPIFVVCKVVIMNTVLHIRAYKIDRSYVE